MASEHWAQSFVHRLEEGGWATYIRKILLGVFVLFYIIMWLFVDGTFKGLSNEKAMEQAQIAREIARGNGFTTKMIRPAALHQFRENKGSFNLEHTPDTYHGPLNPVINAPFLKAVQSKWDLSIKDTVYLPDRVLIAVQFVWMMLGWLMSYFTMKRLFDKRLAVLGVWLLILCQMFWDFAVSGLPQNLIFALFSVAVYCLVRAVENRQAGTATWRWVLGAGAAFSLMALTNALTLWMAVGALVFIVAYFPPRLINAAAFVGIIVLAYTPWLIRNVSVSSNLGGVGGYAILHQVRGSEDSIMRSMSRPLEGVTPRNFIGKVKGNLQEQTTHLIGYLGGLLVAPIFFVALLHGFKRPETGVFRWALLSMWLSCVAGLCIIGIDPLPVNMPFAPPVQANNLHMLFVPMFTAYGLAFLLVMWGRTNITVRLVKGAFLVVVFGVSSLRFLDNTVDFLSILLGGPKARVQWRPYAPPFIAMLGDWTTEREVIASDMPWAVAWYADRKSLWLPMKIQDFIDLNDYNTLNGHIVGLYLTPVSGSGSFVSDIIKGDFKEWALFITRQIVGPSLRDFPLREVTPLPPDWECVFYADRNRWQPKED